MLAHESIYARAFPNLLRLVAASLALMASASAKVSPTEDGAVQRAAQSISSANLCNFRVDVQTLGRFLDGKIDKSKYDGADVAQAMYSVLGSEAIAIDLLGVLKDKTSQRKYCDRQYLLFGPTGTEMPGVLSRTIP